jgi:hypothetical protein
MLWFFLNLLLLALVLVFVFNSELRFSPRFSTNKLEGISRLITDETQDRSREERDEILKNTRMLTRSSFLFSMIQEINWPGGKLPYRQK